jgi:F-type H+/Na+-transporting ATPase subunit alpha
MPLDNSFLDSIQNRIDRFANVPKTEEEGVVIESADGIARVRGMASAAMDELVEFPEKIYGVVFNLERDEVICSILANHTKVKEGAWVRHTGHVISIPVGEAMLGRIINPLGEPLDGKGRIETQVTYPLERPSPGVVDREPVRVPLQTGYKVIDSLVPIGRGQRELIIGDRQTGKTTLALDTIINQRDTGVLSVYVAIGQKDSTVVKFAHKLKDLGIQGNSVIVNAPASAPAMMQYLAPYVGCAIAEYFMYEHHRDTLVVYDDLTKHAAAYRHVSLLMRRPPGREAYPGDIFYLHSRLLERAAKLSKALGGGSMTALPIIETQSNDISAYIPTNVISITDGQIFLESDLFNGGVRPAVNAGISVSRVGGHAQVKAMRQVSGTLRIDLAQYREKEAFSMFASELDPETVRQLKKGSIMVELLKQDKNVPMAVEDQVVVLYAGAGDFLMKLAPDRVADYQTKLLDVLHVKHPELFEEIKQRRELVPDLRKKLDEVIGDFTMGFLHAPAAGN